MDAILSKIPPANEEGATSAVNTVQQNYSMQMSADH